MGGSPTATLQSNPPQHSKSAAAISVDSGISRLSQSASLSAVATAGGLTVNTPLPSMNGHHRDRDEDDGNTLMSRFNLTTPSNHYLHHQHSLASSNNSIETQIGSMPPLHPDAHTDNNGNSNGNKSVPLHQRRRQSAPTT